MKSILRHSIGVYVEGGMRRLGGIELPKREYVGNSRENGALAAYGNLELCGRQRRDTRRKKDNSQQF